jgi:hypothetical protein
MYIPSLPSHTRVSSWLELWAVALHFEGAALILGPGAVQIWPGDCLKVAHTLATADVKFDVIHASNVYTRMCLNASAYAKTHIHTYTHNYTQSYVRKHTEG